MQALALGRYPQHVVLYTDEVDTCSMHLQTAFVTTESSMKLGLCTEANNLQHDFVPTCCPNFGPEENQHELTTGKVLNHVALLTLGTGAVTTAFCKREKENV